MGGYATRVNRFLSLTLSHDDRYALSSSLALRPRSRALVRSFPLVSLPWLVAEDGQHDGGLSLPSPDLPVDPFHYSILHGCV